MKNLAENPNEESLISIIIPAYNVEKYIDKCLSSILDQTYTNIEVIIINDGSTDKTAQIINSISKKDDRVRILHKENAGVSAARNRGIEISTGDYLVFVDGDDYLAKDYAEYMLSLVQKTSSDICLSKCCYTVNGEKQTEVETIEPLKPEEATALLLSPEVIVGCWNKIYKRSFIMDNKLRFSTTLFYGEGLSFITTASQLSNSVGVGNRKVYYYRRNNEASATTRFNLEKIYNGEKALETIRKQLTIKNKKINTMITLHFSLFYLGAIVKIKANYLEKKNKHDYIRWKSYLRRNTLQLLIKKEVSFYRKIMLVGGCLSPWTMMRLDTSRRRHISKNSVE